MAYRIEYTESAIADIAYFKKYERVLIVTAIEEQLTHEPLRAVRNRKPMEANTLARWEVRVGTYRIFYDVEVIERMVLVKAVGWKEHTRSIFVGRNISYENRCADPCGGCGGNAVGSCNR